MMANKLDTLINLKISHLGSELEQKLDTMETKLNTTLDSKINAKIIDI